MSSSSIMPLGIRLPLILKHFGCSSQNRTIYLSSCISVSQDTLKSVNHSSPSIPCIVRTRKQRTKSTVFIDTNYFINTFLCVIPYYKQILGCTKCRENSRKAVISTPFFLLYSVSCLPLYDPMLGKL